MTRTQLSYCHRPQLARRGLLVLCLLASLLLIAPQLGLAAGEWRQWRGNDGSGVAVEEGPLPTSWGVDSENLQWRVEVPGEGISSPIISGDRVFVTTAYEGAQARQRIVIGIALAALVALFLALVWRAARGGPAAAHPGASSLPKVVLGFSLIFVVAASVLTFVPHVLLEEGNPGRAWRVGGAVGLLGLAAAFGWARRGSLWRLIGSIVVLLEATALAAAAPHGPLGPPDLSQTLGPAAPALGLALWYLWQWSRFRSEPPLPASTARRGLAALPLAVLAILLFVATNFLGGLQRVVLAYDLVSGELLWETPVFAAPAEQKWERSTFATPTPTADDRSVFAYFGAGLARVDFDGTVAWVERFPEYARHTRYGAASSAILTADAVILMQEEEAHQGGPESWVAAFDKRSGEVLWRVQPPEARDSYTTPMVVDAGGRSVLLIASWHHLLALDTDTGERLWTYEYPMEQMVASFARSEDLLVISGGVYGDKQLIVMRIRGDGEVPQVEELWRTHRGVATIASPVIYRDMVFALTDNGVLTCYAAESGEQLWKERLNGEYFASLVAGDGKVYATSVEGETTVIAAEPEFHQLAVNRLEDATYASPAIVDGGLLIRTARSLFFIAATGGGDS